MKRTFFAWTIAMVVATAPMVSAQHGGGSSKPMTPHGSQAPKPATTHATTSHTSGSTQHGSASTHGSAATHGSTTTHGGSTTHGSSAHATASHGSGHGATKTASTASMKTKNTKTSSATNATRTTKSEETAKSTSTSGTTTTSTTTLTPVQQKLLRNTNLASKLQTRLPAGTNLTTAAAGFRNLGQFVAAVNVSHNLGIPFADLKTRMVDQHMSLGQAIQDARPATSNTTVVARHAETDADEMIRTSESTASTTTKTTKTHKTTGGRN